MITNERQYRITRAEADKFKAAIDQLESSTTQRSDVHPLLQKAEIDALDSQLTDLLREIEDYESLLNAKAPVIEISSFANLAVGLIQARIAAGLSQKDLADRLGMKQQQIQRYEAEQYAGASLKRLTEIVAALDIRISQDILVPFQAHDFSDIAKKVQQVGLDRDFLTDRLMSSQDAARVLGDVSIEGRLDGVLAGNVSETLNRVFGWTPAMLYDRAPLPPPQMAASSARFKMPAARNQKSTSTYAAYAHYLALVVLDASRDLDPKPIPAEPAAMRQAILESYGDLSLSSCLNFAWDLGVAVLPLDDGGTFHGACWRYGGRNVVVLKQRSKHIARWVFDLLHELFHTSRDLDQETFAIIEGDETSPERRESDEEILASRFAGEVVLDGRAEELVRVCVSMAKGSVPSLKGVVRKVAELERADLGALANYVAFRLSLQGINWWGAAANLQSTDEDPLDIARRVFFDRFSFEVDDNLDRELLQRALQKG